MNRFFLTSVAILTLTTLGLVATSASASDCCQPTYRYEKVLSYETRQVPYTVCETRYDHCGKAYQVHVTRYRTERVQVYTWRRVAVACAPTHNAPAPAQHNQNGASNMPGQSAATPAVPTPMSNMPPANTQPQEQHDARQMPPATN